MSGAPPAGSSTKVYLANLGTTMDDAWLRQTFGAYGTVTNTHIINSPRTGAGGTQRFAGFVYMAGLAEAEAAIKALHNTACPDGDPSPLIVRMADTAESKGKGKGFYGPPGGGWGGGGWGGGEPSLEGYDEETKSELQQWIDAKRRKDYTTSDMIREKLHVKGVRPDNLGFFPSSKGKDGWGKGGWGDWGGGWGGWGGGWGGPPPGWGAPPGGAPWGAPAPGGWGAPGGAPSPAPAPAPAPASAPPSGGWSQAKCPTTGKPYWYNAAGETTWDCPPGFTPY
eukprot:TRINITY_DN2883_c0_g1_i2.p1 TRINITY_DN2883_c0_g1~~TRINITY_DN2883_c0_g1_i2.p1  ORF type:complete len:319 (+),score=84.37 TRINITY_DN2883_c0_g1_i2:115-957(+)